MRFTGPLRRNDGHLRAPFDSLTACRPAMRAAFLEKADPVAPDPDGTTGLADEARAVQDAHARSDRDVAAQRRIGCTHAVASIAGRFPACSISIVSLSSRLAASVRQVAIQAAPAVVSYPRSPWAIHARFSVASCSAIVSGDPSLRTGRVQCSPASCSGRRAQVSPQTAGAGTRNKALDLSMRASPDG